MESVIVSALYIAFVFRSAWLYFVFTDNNTLCLHTKEILVEICIHDRIQ